MSLRIVGFEPNGLPVLGHGRVVLPLLVKCDTQVRPGLCEVGFEPDSFPQLGDGGIVLALLVKGST